MRVLVDKEENGGPGHIDSVKDATVVMFKVFCLSQAPRNHEKLSCDLAAGPMLTNKI